jgi:hypothetical protein
MPCMEGVYLGFSRLSPKKTRSDAKKVFQVNEIALVSLSFIAFSIKSYVTGLIDLSKGFLSSENKF